MNQNYSKFKTKRSNVFVFLLAMLLFGNIQGVKAQLAGNYTIGGSSPDYADFASAIKDLVSSGVKGPVNFSVRPGTYNEPIIITAFSGMSSANPVTFSGGYYSSGKPKNDVVILQNSGISTVYLEGVSFVNFRAMTIEGTNGSREQVVNLGNDNDSNFFMSCIIKTTGTSTNFFPIVLSSDSTLYNKGISNCNNNHFDSCTTFNGYASIYQNGSTTGGVTNFNNTFRWCALKDYAFTGYYIFSGINFKFYADTFSGRVGTASHGMYIGNINGSGVYQCEIRNCTFENNRQTGIALYTSFQSSTVTNPSYITNNVIKGAFASNSAVGIRLSYCRNTNVWNNTVYMNKNNSITTTNSGAIWSDGGGTNLNIRNNILVMGDSTSTQPVLNFPNSGLLNGLVLDNNDYFHKNPTAPLLNLAGTNYDGTNFKGALTYNSNSDNQDPKFVSITDLTAMAPCLTGVTIADSTVVKDYYEVRRGNPYRMGAIEKVTGTVSNDIGVVSIISQNAPVSIGSQDIVAIIRNYGSNTISSANISYSVNGSTYKTITYSKTLLACGIDTVTFTTPNQYNFAKGTSTIIVKVSSPNGTTDPSASNDSVVKVISTPLNGGYIINNTGSGTADFTSFKAATDWLNLGGVSGPVTFTVVPSTYNENFTINAIKGGSNVNRVRFVGRSTDSSVTIVSWNASNLNENYVVKLNSASYVTFTKLTFEAAGTNYSNIFQITGGKVDSFHACKFVGGTSTYGNTYLSTFYLSNGIEDSLVIRNNAFIENVFGIYNPNGTGLKEELLLRIIHSLIKVILLYIGIQVQQE